MLDKNSTKINSLIYSIESYSEKMTSQLLQNILSENKITIEDVKKSSDFKHPLLDGYGRKLLYAGKNFEIMVMSWSQGDYSAIHDHGKTDWGLVQYFGKAEHNIYSFKKNVIKLVDSETTSVGQINLVNNGMIHQMGNLTENNFLSLHIYGSCHKMNPVTQNARIFNLYTNEIQYTNGGVFFLLPEALILKKKQGIFASDNNTLYRHHFHLFIRLAFLISTKNPKEKYKVLYNQLKKILFNKEDYLSIDKKIEKNIINNKEFIKYLITKQNKF